MNEIEVVRMKFVSLCCVIVCTLKLTHCKIGINWVIVFSTTLINSKSFLVIFELSMYIDENMRMNIALPQSIIEKYPNLKFS